MAALAGRKPSAAFKSFLNNVIRPTFKGRNLSELNVMADHAMRAPQLVSFYKKHPEVGDTLKKFQQYVERADKMIPATKSQKPNYDWSKYERFLGKEFHQEFNKTMEQALNSIKVPNMDAWRDEVEAQLEDLYTFIQAEKEELKQIEKVAQNRYAELKYLNDNVVNLTASEIIEKYPGYLLLLNNQLEQGIWDEPDDVKQPYGDEDFHYPEPHHGHH